MNPIDASNSLVGCEDDTGANEELTKGVYYSSKEELKIAVRLWHIVQGVEYTIDCSNKNDLCGSVKNMPSVRSSCGPIVMDLLGV